MMVNITVTIILRVCIYETPQTQINKYIKPTANFSRGAHYSFISKLKLVNASQRTLCGRLVATIQQTGLQLFFDVFTSAEPTMNNPYDNVLIILPNLEILTRARGEKARKAKL